MPTSLPISTDVVVNITTPITEVATNMSIGCILTQDTKPSGWGVSQILAFYSSFQEFAADFGPASSIYAAGESFFGQSPAPAQFAVGLVTGTILEMSLASGRFTFTANPTAGDTITIGSQTYRFESTMAQIGDVKLDVTTLATTIGHLMATINGTGVAGTDMYAGTPSMTSLVTATDDATHLILTAIPTFTPGILVLASSAANAVATQMTLPANSSITVYSAAVLASAVSGGSYLFGWALANSMRDVNVQMALANWCESNELASFLCTNSVSAYDSGSTTDLPAQAKAAALTGACVFFHDNASQYPEIVALATMLSVDYSGVNTTLTLKFKVASGITAANINTTQYNVLNGKNCNMVSLTGNTSIITREGKNSASSWFTDTYCGIQNFRNEIQTAVFNVFLQNLKVPYTVEGQAMLQQACSAICSKYVNNGFFADRSVVVNSKDVLVPAYNIALGDIALASAAMRAARQGPPISITCYLAGAIHSVTLNINMVQ